MNRINIRTAIRTVLVGGAALAAGGVETMAQTKRKDRTAAKKESLKGNIRHSVSKWCFGDYPLDEFCVICKDLGIESIELLDPKDWLVVQRHGLTVAMAQGAGFCGSYPTPFCSPAPSGILGCCSTWCPITCGPSSSNAGYSN